MSKQKDKQTIAKLLYGNYCGYDKYGECKQPNCIYYIYAERIIDARFRKYRKKRKAENTMTKLQQIDDLGKELELAENYPFCMNMHDVAEALVERGYGKIPSCENITTNNPVDEFICSNCGFQMEDFCELRVDEDDGDKTYHEFEIRYFPNCGAKVKAE